MCERDGDIARERPFWKLLMKYLDSLPWKNAHVHIYTILYKKLEALWVY